MQFTPLVEVLLAKQPLKLRVAIANKAMSFVLFIIYPIGYLKLIFP
jgi:hypothetical protein